MVFCGGVAGLCFFFLFDWGGAGVAADGFGGEVWEEGLEGFGAVRMEYRFLGGGISLDLKPKLEFVSRF